MSDSDQESRADSFEQQFALKQTEAPPAAASSSSPEASEKREPKESDAPEIIQQAIEYTGVGGDGVDAVSAGLDKEVPGAGLLNAPKDAALTAKGINEMRSGNTADGVFDTAAGGAGLVGDVGVQQAGFVKGAAEAGKGGTHIYRGIKDGDDDMLVDGINSTLDGVADAAAAFPNPWISGPAKAFRAGKSAGEKLAPHVFSGPAGMQLSDGKWIPSSGNTVADGLAGVGYFSNEAKADRWSHEDPTASSGGGGGSETIQYVQDENGNWVPASNGS